MIFMIKSNLLNFKLRKALIGELFQDFHNTPCEFANI